MKSQIYKITCKVTGKNYVGQTTRTLNIRWESHVYDATKLKKNTKLGRAIRKHGREQFVIQTIEFTENLNERETYFIQLFNSAGKNGYNLKLGGQGGPHAAETKNKISKANKKRQWTPQMRENMSKAIKKWHEERGFVPRSEDTKRKISRSNTGKAINTNAKQAFDERNQRMSKPVICLNDGLEFLSIMEACRNYKINDGHLRMHLKGKHPHVKGLMFKFK